MLLSTFERSHCAEERPASGNAGPADSANPRARTQSRMGHCAAHPPDVAGGTERQPGFALSRVASPGSERRRALEDEAVREQSPGADLHHHRRRTSPAGSGGEKLAAVCPVDASRVARRGIVMALRLWTYVREIARRRQVSDEIDQELAFHLEHEIQAGIERGLSPVEARRMALRDLGGLAQTREATRDTRTTWLDHVVRNLRHSSWRNDKAAAFLALTAFATGIGAATAIYTVVNAVMLKPLPYRDGDRFVAIFSATINDPEHYGSLSRRDAQTFLERTRVFDAFGWFRYAGTNLIFAHEPHNLEGLAGRPDLARALGVDPMLGHWFQDETGVVISAPLWRQLGSDSGIVGKSLTLDGRSYAVAGVMPDHFALPVAGIISVGTGPD